MISLPRLSQRLLQVRAWVLPLSILLLFLSHGLACNAQDSAVAVDRIIQQDLDEDGQPDRTVILCSFATSTDKVVIFDRGKNMRYADTWQEATDFVDDVWAFDAGADGSAELIVAFSTEGEQVVAEIYDDRGIAQTEGFDLETGRIPDGTYWTLKVTAEQAWRRPEGVLNFAIHIQADGDVPVMFQSEFGIYGPQLPHDGHADGEIWAFDEDDDGRPDYQIRRLLFDIPASWGLKRSGMVVNENALPPPDYVNSIFWPYLGDSGGYFKDGSYTDSPPPIVMDWQKGQIAFVESAIPGFPLENGWFLNVFQRIDDGVLNQVSFENPMAYYDLANDHDGAPELHIRNAYFLPHDQYFLGGSFPLAIENIRYSWDQDNLVPLAWDYALHLAARNRITSVLSFQSFDIQAIPYSLLPFWATEQKVDSAIFVAVEAEPRRSSEGIYELGGVRTLRERFLTGDAAVPPWTSATALSVFEGGERVQSSDPPRGDIAGLRVEYNLMLQDLPYLYFSPVDSRLHLLRAEYGLWKVDDHTQVRYANLDGDAYIDRWEYVEDGQVQRQLYALDGYQIFSAEGEVHIKEAIVPPALFQTLPPRNHEEWLALGQQLAAHQHKFGAGDLGEMVAQFEGDEWSVQGGEVRDLRVVEEGFRLVLDLSPGFQVHGSGGPSLSGLPAGSYLVIHDSSYQVWPLTPARATIVSGTLKPSRPVPVVFQASDIQVTFQNTGLEDLANLWIQVYAQGPGSSPHLIAETQVALLAEHEVPMRFDWTPTAAGEWQIGLIWWDGDDPSSASAARTSLLMAVKPSARLEAERILQISNVADPLILVFLLGALCLFAVGLAFVAGRAPSAHEER